jgi:hypothetical protein
VGNAAGLVRQEAAHNLPARADDAHVAIEATEEQTVGSGTHARNLIALEKVARLVVTGSRLVDVEEVKRLPLGGVSSARRTGRDKRVGSFSVPSWPWSHYLLAMPILCLFIVVVVVVVVSWPFGIGGCGCLVVGSLALGSADSDVSRPTPVHGAVHMSEILVSTNIIHSRRQPLLAS